MLMTLMFAMSEGYFGRMGLLQVHYRLTIICSSAREGVLGISVQALLGVGHLDVARL